VAQTSTNHAFSFLAAERGDRLTFSLHYAAAFTTQGIRGMVAHFRQLAPAVAPRHREVLG